MLITNFAAGELSETLYGRVDLPQYYQGASRIENFDVVPTGGIRRRQGTRRLDPLMSGGKLIPYVVDEQNSFFLYVVPRMPLPGLFVPGSFYLYDRNFGIVDIVDEGSPRGPNHMEIYAKDMDTLRYVQTATYTVLVQENLRPIVLRLEKNKEVESGYQSWLIYANNIDFSFAVDVEVPDGTDAAEFSEDDKTYTKTRYLVVPPKFPRSVTNWNGRLVFAGCIENPQRIFASKVNDIFNFSTYTKIVTERRDYVLIQGTLNTSNGTFTPTTITDIGKFTRDIGDYYVKGGFYPEEARVSGYADGKIYIAGKAKTQDIDPAQIPVFYDWVYNLNYNLSAPYQLSNKNEKLYEQVVVGVAYGLGSMRAKAQEYTMGFLRNTKEADYILTADEIRQACDPTTAIDFLEAWVRDKLTGVEITEPAVFTSFLYYFQHDISVNCVYTLAGTTYYGTPRQLEQQIFGSGKTTVSTFISFYAKEYLVEKVVTPEDGFTFEIASDLGDPIRWITQNKDLIIGTTTSEWIVPAGTTATNIQAILNSRYGSDVIPAVSVGDALVFVQCGRKAAIEYYIPQQDSYFRTNNMAQLDRDILAESAPVALDFVSSPYTKIYFVREDGTMAVLLYDRGSGVFAWGRMVTDGKILDVVTIPNSEGVDEVYLTVVRKSAGENPMTTIEVLEEGGDAFLDSYVTYTSASLYEYDHDTAFVADLTDGKSYPLNEAPSPDEFDPSHRVIIGYPYTSRVRSMPVLANDRMKPNAIKNLTVRFYKSHLPLIKSLPNGALEKVHRDEPFTGALKIPFPGSWDTDVLFEFIHEQPNGCHILAVNAEVN
jgi:hypothetical protein